MCSMSCATHPSGSCTCSCIDAWSGGWLLVISCVCDCLGGAEITGCQLGLHGIITLCMLCAAAGDDEGHAEDAFEDEDAEHASVSSSEPLAHRGQVCITLHHRQTSLYRLSDNIAPGDAFTGQALMYAVQSLSGTRGID